MLQFCNDDPASLLVVEFIVVPREFDTQLLSHSIMFSNPQGMHKSQQWLLSLSIIAFCWFGFINFCFFFTFSVSVAKWIIDITNIPATKHDAAAAQVVAPLQQVLLTGK